MEEIGKIKVLFIAGFGPIVREPTASRKLYKREPWGQTVSRFITPEGLLVGITFTPSMREEK